MSGSMWAKLGMTWEDAALTVVTAVGIYLAIIVFSRLFGQRQFSTASSYDLAFTFAMGSLVGRVILVRTSLSTAVLGLATMFTIHAVTGWLHHHVAVIHRAVQNRPIMVVAHGRVLEDGMRTAKLSHAELHQQVRLAGMATLEAVDAIILERNGQMSVIAEGTPLDERVFVGVPNRAELFDDPTSH